MSRGPLFLSAVSGLASLAASNPTALSDLTGGGVRIGHNSAAEVLQAAMGRTVAPPGCLKLGGCQDTGSAWEQLRASCGPPGPNRTALSDLPTTKP